MSDEATQPKPSTDDLPEAIRKISRGAERLLASGLNRKAVIVLLCHHSGMGQKIVVTVLDSLAALERSYTARPGATTKVRP